jgi:hypothetical protein
VQDFGREPKGCHLGALGRQERLAGTTERKCLMTLLAGLDLVLQWYWLSGCCPRAVGLMSKQFEGHSRSAATCKMRGPGVRVIRALCQN